MRILSPPCRVSLSRRSPKSWGRHDPTCLDRATDALVAVDRVADSAFVTREEHALVEVERRRLCALVDADLVTAEELHADDFQLITPRGFPYSKREYLDAVRSGLIDYLVWDPEQIDARVHGDAGCLRYAATINMRFDGTETGPRRYWHTDYYERRDGCWHVIWSQATEIDS
jgi:hypothetical protein